MWLQIHESRKSSHGQLLPWLDSGQRCEKWARTNVFDNYLARMALPVCFRPSYSSLFTINGQENVLPENVIRVYFWMNTSKEGREQRDSLFIAKKNIFQINLHCPLRGFSMCFHSICFHGRAEIEEHDRPFHMQHTCRTKKCTRKLNFDEAIARCHPVQKKKKTMNKCKCVPDTLISIS